MLGFEVIPFLHVDGTVNSFLVISMTNTHLKDCIETLILN